MKERVGNKHVILSLSWRDIKSPKAGGAEIHTHEMLKSVNPDKYSVCHISMHDRSLPRKEYIDGICYIRSGNVIGVLFAAFFYYMRNRKKINIVIDQCNTFRFFTKFWVNKKKRVFYIHQLTREIWNIQLGGFFAKLGQWLENPMLKLNKNDYTITVSKSTKDELVEIGFNDEKITIIPNGLPYEIYKRHESFEKEDVLTFIYVGRYAKYKGIDDAISAFGELKKINLSARLWIVGREDMDYLSNVLIPICHKYQLSYGSDEERDVVFWDFVSEEKKFELMQRAHILICPSIREGWGIIISEAGYLGTPSIVYNSPGLRDAVDYGKAGYLCRENTIEELVIQMQSVVNQYERYTVYQKAAKSMAEGLKWENNYEIINEFMDHIIWNQEDK